MTTLTSVQSRLEAVRQLSNLDAALVARFGDFLASAPDDQVFRMSPLISAQRLGATEAQALDLFLCATHAGLLELAWGVLCPMCAGFITSVDGIRSLGNERRCSFCEIQVAGVLDDSIEVAFTVAPQVRSLRFARPEEHQPGDEFLTYFSRSMEGALDRAAQFSTNVRSRHRVEAGGSVVVEADLAPGRYALLAPLQHAMSHINVRQSGSGHVAELDLLAGGDLVPASVTLAPGKASLKLTNRTRDSVSVIFLNGVTPAPEDRPKDMPCHAPKMVKYLTGKRLLTTQVFRDLFRAESVPGEAGIALKNLSLLFTDLKGSTEMYERIGDLRAFDLVSRHFDLLRDLVRSRGGAVVKTIGDAVMASFSEPAGALDAAAAMTRDIRSIGDLELKIGIHAGPCIAVQSNEQLDYFGQTVNIAARVQGIARAGEIVCTSEVMEAAGSAEVVRAASLKAVAGSAMLKGVEGAVAVHRLR